MEKYHLNAGAREFGCYVYAVLCEDSAGKGFVKFGISTKIDKRLSSIRTSCPLDVGYFAIHECFNSSEMKSLEKALFLRFAKRRGNGEWFSFDFKNEQDKKEFNAGSREVFRGSYNKDGWDKIHPEAMAKAKEVWNAQNQKQWAKRVCSDAAFFRGEEPQGEGYYSSSKSLRMARESNPTRT